MEKRLHAARPFALREATLDRFIPTRSDRPPNAQLNKALSDLASK